MSDRIQDPGLDPIPPIERARLIHEWLRLETDGGQHRFSVTWLSENEGVRKVVIKPLSETVFVHHSDPSLAKKKLMHLGFDKLAESLDRRPKSHNTRLGNFGEIIATEFLRQTRGYDVPVYRLRYNTNDESSPKGDDVLAFEFADKATRRKNTVIVGEVKVRSEFKSSVVEEAHDALRKGFRPRPKSFLFVVDILFGEGREEEAKRLLDFSIRFGKNALVRRSCLFIVTGNKPGNPFGCLVGRRLAPGLEAFQLTLDDLTGFVNQLFEAEVDLNEF